MDEPIEFTKAVIKDALENSENEEQKGEWRTVLEGRRCIGVDGSLYVEVRQITGEVVRINKGECFTYILGA